MLVPDFGGKHAAIDMKFLPKNDKTGLAVLGSSACFPTSHSCFFNEEIWFKRGAELTYRM